MIRGIRGATTITENDAEKILRATEALVTEMITKNDIKADDVAHVIITVTDDIDAAFPAKAIRSFEGWTYVPVMCSREIPVPGSLEHCIRIMMTVNTTKAQQDIEHVYLEKAVQLRPDLQLTKDHRSR
ncbi:chorismate mutase [Desertibacillus haloalkaliphilus]|uniref:chorismate mutase n=1 Tax=Desertibacillus haloalkaliphilus TaxID=1328930 RepID=UPI001C27D819|nr:chorismate mutase [Desertibacillus haloalkaliphilus]MBU8907248.1 chorismate mutase [Desertibacillus haloalkaliphilus]